MATDKRQAAMQELAKRELEKRKTGTGVANTIFQYGTVGPIETAAQVATGAVAAPVAGLVGLAGAMLPGKQGQGARWAENTQSFLTYEPKTQAGKDVSGTLAKPFEWLEKGADFAGDKAGGSSPLAETAVKTILLSLPVAAGLRGPKGAARQLSKPKQVQLPSVKDIADSPDKKARRLVAEALERDGLTPDEAVKKLQELGPNARLADLGENLATLARASAAKPGPARTRAKDFLEERHAGQQLRLIKTTGLGNVKEFKTAFRSAMTDRQSKAAPFYKEAYESPLNLATPEMQALMKRPSMRAAVADAAKILADEGGGGGHVRIMDAAKRSLDDKIGAAIRSGERETARRLSMIKRELVSEVDRQVPAYKRARDTYAGEAAMRDAAQLGRNILTKKLDLDDAEVIVQQMGDGERRAFQMGAMRGLVDKLENTATGRNSAGKLIESTRAKEVLRIAFEGDPSLVELAISPKTTLDKLLSTAEAESKFASTRATVRGGSPTARIQQDISGMEGTASAAAALVRGDYFGTARQILKNLGVGKVSDKTLAEVARLLFDETRPPKGMRFNPRGELVPNPRGPNTGRIINVPGVTVPPLPQLPRLSPGGAAAGGVIAGTET